MKKLILSLTVLLCAGTLAANSIASESFAKRDNGQGYISNTDLNDSAHNTNLLGTTGFSDQDEWHRGTANVRTRDFDGLTHDLVVGDTYDGIALLRPAAAGVTRISRRPLASEPTGSTFYMSGLVSMRGDATNIHLGSDARMGVSSWLGLNENNFFDPGFSLGLRRELSGDVFMVASADGNTYTLGDALTGTTLDGSHMIVLRAELGASPGANDTLTAWYALAGAPELTLAGSWSDINIADSLSDLSAFGIGVTTSNDGQSGTSSGAAFDEWRFGTSLDAVAIPEPGTLGFILGASVFIFLLVRARLSK